MERAYLQLLNLMQQEASLGVDVQSQKLLELIGVAHAKGKPMTVTQAMALDFIASPATVHRKLKQLIEAGLINAVVSPDSRRTKYLVPTAKAQAYFQQVGELVLRITR